MIVKTCSNALRIEYDNLGAPFEVMCTSKAVYLISIKGQFHNIPVCENCWSNLELRSEYKDAQRTLIEE